jgi:cyclase
MIFNRLIAVLIIRDGNVVQSVNFEHTNIIHDKPTIAIEHFCKWAVDEIVVIDVSREKRPRDEFFDLVQQITAECFVPVSVGGWISNVIEISLALKTGADKILINSSAYDNPSFITEAAERFGKQCITVGIDCIRSEQGGHEVVTHRGSNRTGKSAVEWAHEVVDRGAGEIFVTSIENDGMRMGYDLPLMKSIASSVSVPVVAFGGVSDWSHLRDGFIEAGVDAVALANYLHYIDNSARKAKRYLKRAGIRAR